jgi:hypothetical protein
MRKVLIGGALLALVAAAAAWAGEKEEERPLLAKVRGEIECPEGLYEVYAGLAGAMKAGDVEGIRAPCLPGAVEIEKKPREKSVEYGRNVNLPFAKERFMPDVFLLRDEGAGCVLVRTGTSWLRFVKTAEHGWRLYDYGDKPIM